MTTFKSLVLFSSILVASCYSPPPLADPIHEMYPAEQEEIKQLILDIFKTAQEKNMEKLDAYHLNSPKFTKYDDGEIPDRQDYAIAKRSEEELFTSISDFSYELPDLKVDVFDDTAISTFTLDYTVLVDDTTSISAKSRSTLVFVLKDDQWKIAHEHFSPYTEPQD